MATLSGRKQLIFWIPAALLAAVLLIAIYLQVRRPYETRSAVYVNGNPEKGAALFYGNKQCGICHAVNGSGGRIAPDLSGTRPSAPAMGWLVTVVWNHGPGMWRRIRQKNQSYPDLSSQDMANLLAFLYQATNTDRPGDASAGQQVFRDKGCSQCHSVGGVGGTKAADLSTVAAGENSAAWTQAMLNHADSMVVPIKSTLGDWPEFSGTQMNDLIAYVNAGVKPVTAKSPSTPGNAERGWIVFQGRCMRCHSVRGQGGAIGPELGPNHDIPLTTAQFASLMWNHAPSMLEAGSTTGVAPSQLQGNDMADLLAFLAGLRYYEPSGSPLVGERVFAQRGCATCHGAKAEGTEVGPSLKAGPEAYTTVSFTAALWRHGPKMFESVEQRGMQWPTLEPNDIGELVSFLNAH
jgi:mono/diheme cytochrome c family protein